MIDHDKKVIFVHIQKTGGTSINIAFGKTEKIPERHRFARDLRETYGEGVWDSYFEFAFVRNPWDRLVSWWSMIDSLRTSFESGRPLNKFHTFVLTQARTFEEFLDRCNEEISDHDGRKWIFRNQIDYLTDASGQIIVDFVGRFENIAHDYELIATRVGGLPPLSHGNKSPHAPYVTFYTPELMDKVRKMVARDIAAFGYVFGC